MVCTSSARRSLEASVTGAGWRAGRAVPAAEGVARWLVTTAISTAVIGLLLGAALGVFFERVIAPLAKALRATARVAGRRATGLVEV